MKRRDFFNRLFAGALGLIGFKAGTATAKETPPESYSLSDIASLRLVTPDELTRIAPMMSCTLTHRYEIDENADTVLVSHISMECFILGGATAEQIVKAFREHPPYFSGYNPGTFVKYQPPRQNFAVIDDEMYQPKTVRWDGEFRAKRLFENVKIK